MRLRHHHRITRRCRAKRASYGGILLQVRRVGAKHPLHRWGARLGSSASSLDLIPTANVAELVREESNHLCFREMSGLEQMDEASARLEPAVVPRKLSLNRDERGRLLKILMRYHLPEERREFGEIYVTAARPGEVKGNDFHRQASEWFCAAGGRGKLVTKNSDTGETLSF